MANKIDKDKSFQPFNRFRYRPDYTNIESKIILFLLILLIIFGVVFVASYYF
ncbi:hypothetical protein [Parvicella tangerina]|uniref:Uncharacterized protein n=1 Tax=Parvicella tangerina TaxID=2829795 RepID=A0A916NAZ3_9FLAO|nr:hypothetical protein [Parvicella tangerina]CAG5080065.1 hypothetical protein CRYO30217_01169 [Parvicella tangerina]